MDGVGAHLFRKVNDAVNVEIASNWSRSDKIALVSLLNIAGSRVRLGMDGDGPYAEFLAGPDDPKGDFAPVGY